MPPLLLYRTIRTPLGDLLAVADDTGIRILEFCDGDGLDRAALRIRAAAGSRDLLPGDHPHLTALADELAQYFAGGRQMFSVPLFPHGTDFQRRAWDYLRTIPYGQTRSYGQQALALGDLKAVRAVGRANGANPLAIVVPCHRVIGASGHLTGYAGGLDRKLRLLEHEQQVIGFQPLLIPIGGGYQVPCP